MYLHQVHTVCGARWCDIFGACDRCKGFCFDARFCNVQRLCVVELWVRAKPVELATETQWKQNAFTRSDPCLGGRKERGGGKGEGIFFPFIHTSLQVCLQLRRCVVCSPSDPAWSKRFARTRFGVVFCHPDSTTAVMENCNLLKCSKYSRG